MESRAHFDLFVLLLCQERLPCIVRNESFDQVQEKVLGAVVRDVRQISRPGLSGDRRIHVHHHATQRRLYCGFGVDFFDRATGQKSPCRDDTLLKTINHLVHQEWDIPTVGEDP